MKQYVVDAFTDRLFTGNPAAVCVTDEALSDTMMQNIACENNLSETAFAIRQKEGYSLRWFTPGGEIDLCGHATLATAYVVMNFIDKELTTITFHTLSGDLKVHKIDQRYEMDFPAFDMMPIQVDSPMVQALGATPIEAYLGRDLLCVFEDEKTVFELKPDMSRLKNLDGLLVHATALGSKYDCVSRSFAPKLEIDEDPVCGSGHCHIIPYWSQKQHKSNYVAYQASNRGGILFCKMDEGRIRMSGECTLYSIAEVFI